MKKIFNLFFLSKPNQHYKYFLYHTPPLKFALILPLLRKGRIMSGLNFVIDCVEILIQRKKKSYVQTQKVNKTQSCWICCLGSHPLIQQGSFSFSNTHKKITFQINFTLIMINYVTNFISVDTVFIKS